MYRPIWDLVASSIGDMFSLGGRLWRTLPLLVLRPCRMTREYIDAKRARYVPLFRLFLLTSVIFFLTCVHGAGKSALAEGNPV
ncbi:MAG: DUF3667 domain-containing protein [Hyphomonas sp.]|uniref:DUF3667 domain-containing protein n=1 Tax=Hyphomonas sp. TaxID=87 RepID=UPI0034A029AC